MASRGKTWTGKNWYYRKKEVREKPNKLQANSPEATEQVVPEHNVLPIVALRDAVVNIVDFGIVQCHAKEGNDAVVPSVVESGQDGANDEKDDGRGGVKLHAQRPTIQKARKDVIVLAKEEFHGMDVDGVHGSSAAIARRK